ncbi:outer membrane assembly protein [Capnocytophaga canis]|uniref:outer membrane assembly protein n=1 Tax=Capnocytophaga TaxID=1016 RepID=UPI000BB1C3B2|nr:MULTISPECIES: outer membrane assembly protein [unclassified Capnocytophaga]ATA73083.1 outer membrane assembly protein [Capnocytophaga sp. H4358]ATA75173.1 outer membrane assembly protein [Capnocytophaga sp. H2931]
MKYIIGIIVVLIILSVSTYFLADLWEYDTLITPQELKKGAVTVMIVGAVSVLLLILVPFFFKDHDKGYDKNHNGIAQPKKNTLKKKETAKSSHYQK